MKNLIQDIKIYSKKYRIFKDHIFWIRFTAYAIPLAFLLYVLYVNFLPFGYNKTFVIEVGGPNDTIDDNFYLISASGLSERKIDINNQSYRELDGSVFTVFKTQINLDGATAEMSITGENVSIIPPVINFDPDTITDWDYNWDFSKKIPEDFIGNAFLFEESVYFNNSRLELPDSADKFESDPFTVYVEWEPKNSENNSQQIVGHFNWELWQNKESVSFEIGKMNNSQGLRYSIRYPIDSNFFNKKHTALAVYSPGENGYFELYIDGNFANRIYFGTDKIWTGYGNQNLSLGWSRHFYEKKEYYTGAIFRVSIVSKNILQFASKTNFGITTTNMPDIQIVSTSDKALIRQIKLNISKKQKRNYDNY